MNIRDAVPEDAVAACAVLRRSISELCVADHRGDPAILARSLGNKTPEIVASWITRPGNSLLLAVDGSTILGVGSVTDKGEITLGKRNSARPPATRCRGACFSADGVLLSEQPPPRNGGTIIRRRGKA